MTPHTDAERAEFEAWARSYGTWDVVRDDAPHLGVAGYSDAVLTIAWHAVQACRRAQAAPVPQGLREAAQRAHDWMESQADSQSKGNYHSFDLFCLRHERDALAEALAAAPQPPDAEQCQSCRTGSPYACTCTFKTDRNSDPSCFEAAAVQLPEPVAKIEGGSLKWHIPDAGYSLPVRYLQGTQMLYTEQQVRQLLAAHGIKEQNT